MAKEFQVFVESLSLFAYYMPGLIFNWQSVIKRMCQRKTKKKNRLPSSHII